MADYPKRKVTYLLDKEICKQARIRAIMEEDGSLSEVVNALLSGFFRSTKDKLELVDHGTPVRYTLYVRTDLHKKLKVYCIQHDILGMGEVVNTLLKKYVDS